MSDFDDQVHEALSRTLDALKAHVESDLSAFQEELSRVAAEEGQRLAREAADTAAIEAKQAADLQLSQWRETAAREAEERERDVVARERQAEAREHDAEAREHEADARRQEAEARQQLAERTIDGLRRSLEDARQDAQRELHDTQRELETARDAAAAVQQQLDEELKRIEELETQIRQFDEAMADSSRLPEAIRQIDQAESLGEALDALAQFAAREAGRAVVFLVKGERLRDWRVVGFDRNGSDARIELRADEPGPLALAVQGQRGSHRGSDLPGFAAGLGPRCVVTLPVTVGGAVVAVLYVDGPETDNEREPTWAARVDVLARYAGRILESITIRQAAGLSPIGPVRTASHSSVSGHPPAGSIQ